MRDFYSRQFYESKSQKKLIQYSAVEFLFAPFMKFKLTTLGICREIWWVSIQILQKLESLLHCITSRNKDYRVFQFIKVRAPLPFVGIALTSCLCSRTFNSLTFVFDFLGRIFSKVQPSDYVWFLRFIFVVMNRSVNHLLSLECFLSVTVGINIQFSSLSK